MVEMAKIEKDLSMPVPVWQSALIALGCQLDNGSQIVPLKLEPVGSCLRCMPTFSGSILPFDIPVGFGQAVTISWDDDLSRYIVESRGEQRAA
jgi:hypothetical protein